MIEPVDRQPETQQVMQCERPPDIHQQQSQKLLHRLSWLQRDVAFLPLLRVFSGGQL